MTTIEITNSDDLIDVRDVIARVETLETERDEFEHDEDGNRTESDWTEANPDESGELASLTKFLAELCGMGGDERWRGDWYPITAIRESYFTEYCEELVKDIGDLPRDLPGYVVIDWKATAENLLVDYAGADFDGVTYYVR